MICPLLLPNVSQPERYQLELLRSMERGSYFNSDFSL